MKAVPRITWVIGITGCIVNRAPSAPSAGSETEVAGPCNLDATWSTVLLAPIDEREGDDAVLVSADGLWCLSLWWSGGFEPAGAWFQTEPVSAAWLGDVDYHGVIDALWSADGDIYIDTSPGDGEAPRRVLSGTDWPVAPTWELGGDFNGDGLLDVMVGAVGDWYVAVGDEGGFQTPELWIDQNGKGAELALAGEVQGNGCDDLVVARTDGATTSIEVGGQQYWTECGPMLETPTATDDWDNYYYAWTSTKEVLAAAALGDVSGDGVEDLVFLSETGDLWVACSEPPVFKDAVLWQRGIETTGHLLAGQLDGDGLADLALLSTTGDWQVWLTKGEPACSTGPN